MIKNLKYYKQQSRTDCLLTAAENLTQVPRNLYENLKWREFNEDKYLYYKSFSDIIRFYNGGAKVIFGGQVKLDYKPAVIGSLFRAGENYSLCHSYFWDGANLFCPARGKFVSLEEIDTSYLILNINTPNINIKDFNPIDLETICTKWDEMCDYSINNIKNSEHKYNKIEKLITLEFNGRIYPGDIERVNTIRA